MIYDINEGSCSFAQLSSGPHEPSTLELKHILCNASYCIHSNCHRHTGHNNEHPSCLVLFPFLLHTLGPHLCKYVIHCPQNESCCSSPLCGWRRSPETAQDWRTMAQGVGQQAGGRGFAQGCRPHRNLRYL